MEAVELYNKVVSEKGNEGLSAQAQLRIGMCYEKLGQKSLKLAQDAFQKVIDNYPSQSDEVRIARERLSRLIQIVEKVSEAPLVPKFTKMKIPTKLSWCVKLSPDSKDLALVSDKKLWKMPLSGNLGKDFPGTPVQINTEGIEVDWSGLSWSDDNKWIAFNERERPVKNNEENIKRNRGIFRVLSDGGKLQRIVETYRGSLVVNYRISLSPDGKNLAFTSVEDNKKHIFSMSVEGGNPKQLVEIEAREPVYSPDGNLIAFVRDKNAGRNEGGFGLWIVPASGGTPQLVADAGKASSPVWSPDGSMIAFLDYTKGKQIFIVPVIKAGRALGKPISIEAPEGTEEVRLLAGWTLKDKIGALLIKKLEFALYTLPASGGQAAIILNGGYPVQPRWSPDNKNIFYTVDVDKENSSWKNRGLAVVPSGGGEFKLLPRNGDAEINVPFAYQAGNRVSPNGKMIISAAKLPNDSNFLKNYPSTQIWKIPIDGGKATQITKPVHPFIDLSPCWSPDGNKVAFIRQQLIKGLNPYGDVSIYIVDSLGRESEILTATSDEIIFSPAWSPDGKMIAYLNKEKKDPYTETLNVINISSGESRVVGEVPTAHVNIELAWSHDSKRIAFNDDEDKVIKIMNLDDGNIEDISTGLVDVNIYHLDWSPNGERFVFGGWKGGNAEFWFLENFLPLDKLPQKNEKEGFVIRKVIDGTGAGFEGGKPSPDGRYISYKDQKTGDLAIREIATGKTQRLTNKGSLDQPREFVINSEISPDSQLVAYIWTNQYTTYDLCLIGIDGSGDRILYSGKYNQLQLGSWSSDGEQILFKKYSTKPANLEIILVSIGDGTTQVLKTFEKPFVPRFCYSPDDRFIAYDFPSAEKSGNYDINLLATDGSGEIHLIEHPANDRLLGWVPNREEMLFLSNRTGTYDIWAIKVENGKEKSMPWPVKRDIGQISPKGFTKDGSFYYSINTRRFTTEIAPFDLKTGNVQEELSAPLFVGSNFTVEWSPDGENLVYKTEKTDPAGPGFYNRPLYVRNLQTGEERELASEFEVNEPRWSPDGRFVLVIGHFKTKENQSDYNEGIYKIDAQNNQVTQIVELPPDHRSIAEWSPDGKAVFYKNRDRILMRDLESGREKQLYQNNNLARFLDLSSDGKRLVFVTRNPDKETWDILIMLVSGGEPRELCKLQGSDVLWSSDVTWTPDGNYVLFAKYDEKKGSTVWRIPAEGGEPEMIWQSKDPDGFVVSLSVHPQGSKIAISFLIQEKEFWVMENFLPKDKDKK